MMTKTTKLPISGAIACVLFICLLPATSRAGVTLNFTFNSAGSSGAVSANLLSTLTENISTIAINGTSYSGLTDQLTVTSTGTADIFSISGGLNGELAGVSGTWLVFETQPSSATENGAGDFLITYGNGTLLDSISSVLASDLGVTFATGAGGVSIGAGNGALIDSQGQVISNVLSPTLASSSVATPEPFSSVMLALGLLVVFMVGGRTLCGPLFSRSQSLLIVARGAAQNSLYRTRFVRRG